MILIRSKRNSDCRENDVSDFALYQNRRAFIRQLGVTAAGIACAPSVFGDGKNNCNNIEYPKPDSPPTDLRSITHYNNYYEFSPNKEAVAVLAQELTTSPWTLTIKGEVEKEITLDVDTINTLCVSERIYRLRCVEGWSMIIPWQGVGLHQVIRLAKPLSSAKYVKFIGIERPSEMIGQRRPSLPWPYAEGLRIDEAVHPLTILATGLYGQTLPKQNGAPLRLVVPWKYGFKSIKAIQAIELVEQQPLTSWVEASPSEYGFYANVNPDVAHPRWSQRREVPIGSTKKIKTLPFNGYADQVAHLYSGMDLSKHY